jgi:redox-sensitive bicupin YhaK (pirin superfamily)
VAAPLTAEERAVYACNGAIEIDGQRLEPYEMAILAPGAAVQITALADAHFVMIGGEPLTERHIYWNFVSSRQERIEQAKADWQKQDGIAFPKVPGDEVEFIPLPE